jgi:hypothetical protein
MTSERRLMDALTRAEINEIERRKREENDARIRQLFGCVSRHPSLNTQAIEARRAETGTGSVHESAVGSADAPNPSQETPHDPL